MSSQSINIAGTEMLVIEYHGQRVCTFAMIDKVHQRPSGTARKRFNDNRKHFVKGEDFYSLDSSSLSVFRTDYPGIFGDSAQHAIVLTEMGYLMVVKSLKDDLAWQVQRELVNVYFGKPKEETWSQLRLFGKSVHKTYLTDPVKLVWELAQTQGSATNQDKFQQAYAKMIKQIFGYENRDTLSAVQLAKVIESERLAGDLIRRSVDEGIHYKDIFQHAKDKVSAYADILIW